MMKHKLQDPSFDAADMRTRRLQTRDTLLTTILWFVYAYLWLPLISLAAWLIGLDYAYNRVLEAGGLEGLAKITSWYGYAVLVIVLLVIGWSVSQRIRFRGKDRRRAGEPIAPEELREEAGLAAEDFTTLRRAQTSVVSFAADGTIDSVRQA